MEDSVIPPEDALDELLFRYLERVDAGESATGVLEELCNSNPSRAAELRRGIALMRDTRLHPGPAGDGIPERIADFRLLRRLGAGGMGVVYLAREEPGGRRVALKLVRPDMLGSGEARPRFEREVTSAARLSHPGIARALASGEHGGVPWFAQEFVQGTSLGDLLGALPARTPEGLTGTHLRTALAESLAAAPGTGGGDEDPAPTWDDDFFRGGWVQVCARIARQVADALQHAHERGVLHRDVKPSNLLLTPDGRAVLVDFGLANASGSDPLTRSGALLGSFAYMSPEQVEGQTRGVGPRSDVYSLGVTLYELLTLRRPYASPSVERIRALILAGAAPSARRLNRDVPRDLATLCAYAMERAPERRYDTAGAMAADLANFLAHRPIQAAPVGRHVRLARWMQRHPALATGLLVGLPLLALGPSALALQRARANERLAARNAQLEQALADTDGLFVSALEAVDHVVASASRSDFDHVPGLSEARRELADKALEVVDRIQAQPGSDTRRLELARAMILEARADVSSDIGDYDAVRADCARMLEALAGLDLDAVGDPVLIRFSTALGTWGSAEENSGRPERALPLYEDAFDLLRRVGEAEFPNTQSDVVLLLVNISRARAKTADDEGAAAALELALERSAELLQRAPDHPAVHDAHGRLLVWRASIALGQGDLEASERDFSTGVTHAERAYRGDPSSRSFRLRYIEAVCELARVQVQALRFDESHATHGRALALLDAYLAEYPDAAQIEGLRGKVRGNFARVLSGLERHDEAIEVMHLVAERQEELAEAQPGNLGARITSAVAWLNLTGLIVESTDPSADRIQLALESAQRGETILLPAIENAGHIPEVQRIATYLEAHLAMAHVLSGDFDPAADRLERLLRMPGKSAELHYVSAQTHALFARSAADAGLEWQRIEAARETALAELDTALGLGFSALERFLTDETLDWLADDPRYDELRRRLEQRASAQ